MLALDDHVYLDFAIKKMKSYLNVCATGELYVVITRRYVRLGCKLIFSFSYHNVYIIYHNVTFVKM